MIYEYSFLLALIKTTIVEVFVAFLFFHYLFSYPKLRRERVLITVILASALTLPYLWFILPVFLKSRFLYIFIGELGVFLVEACIYALYLDIGIKRALVLSLLANSASFLSAYLTF